MVAGAGSVRAVGFFDAASEVEDGFEYVGREVRVFVRGRSAETAKERGGGALRVDEGVSGGVDACEFGGGRGRIGGSVGVEVGGASKPAPLDLDVVDGEGRGEAKRIERVVGVGVRVGF